MIFKTAITVCVNILNSDQLQTSVAKEIVGKILLEVCVVAARELFYALTSYRAVDWKA